MDGVRRCALHRCAVRRARRGRADASGAAVYPDKIATYLIDWNINDTNVSCDEEIRALHRVPKHAEGWVHVSTRSCGAVREKAVRPGATQIMLQAVDDPETGVETDEVMFSAIRWNCNSRYNWVPPRSRTWRGLGDLIEEAMTRIHAAGLDVRGRRERDLVVAADGRIVPPKESGSAGWRSWRLCTAWSSRCDVHDGHRRDERRAHRAPAHDPRRAGRHRRLLGPSILWTYEPKNNHLKGRTQATELEYLAPRRGGPAVLREVSTTWRILVYDWQERRPAHHAHGCR